MLFKLIWLLVLIWIAVRVYRAGKELLGLATGTRRTNVPPRSTDRPQTGPQVHRPKSEAAPEPSWKAEVQDARFADLS